LEAVTVFADPSVEFGLQFTRASGPAPEVLSETTTRSPAPVAKLPAAAESAGGRDGPGQDNTGQAPGAAEAAEEPAEQGDEAEGADKVVTLDRFRKK
jgi:hypothetical protein